jgi:succinylarginine dihydrolase
VSEAHRLREVQFDGLVGPTHNYAGLSPGNVASARNAGDASNPKQAALEGLRKMAFVRRLGIAQAVLPPHERPSLQTLRALGFQGRDEEVLASAARHDGGHLLRLASSASAMWSANAATVTPSTDTQDGRCHFTPANLTTMFHRAIEARERTAIFRAIFANGARFVVHDPLPGGAHFSDEGAANHTRLHSGASAVHLFAWGKRSWGAMPGPTRHPARHALEASQAIARSHGIHAERTLFWQQHPEGIDGGSFHTDVLAVGSGSLLLAHELAFTDRDRLEASLRASLGDACTVVWASNDELPVADAVDAYPFNSQLLERDDGTFVIVAPIDAKENARAHAFLSRVVADVDRVKEVHYLDVRQSMRNGGGPACLRLRVPLTAGELQSLGGRVLLTDALEAELEAWIEKHYPDRIAVEHLGDARFVRGLFHALDELTGILGLGSIYDFQRT